MRIAPLNVERSPSEVVSFNKTIAFIGPEHFEYFLAHPLTQIRGASHEYLWLYISDKTQGKELRLEKKPKIGYFPYDFSCENVLNLILEDHIGHRIVSIKEGTPPYPKPVKIKKMLPNVFRDKMYY